MKVSQDGYDIGTCSDFNLVFSSKYDILKIAQTGTGSFVTGGTATISHSLGYSPSYLLYLSNDGTQYSLYHGTGVGGLSKINGTNLIINKPLGTTIDYYYPNGTNDYGRENSVGYVAGYTKVGFDAGFGSSTKGAFRFPSVSDTSSVTKAELGFYIWDRTGTTVQVVTYGIDEDDTADFSSSPFGRTKTTNSVTNSCDAGISIGDHWVYDVTDIYQEITSRAGWTSGNAMGFMLEDNGNSGTTYIIDDSLFDGQNNSYLKITKTGTASTIYYKYVIFYNKLDGTRTFG